MKNSLKLILSSITLVSLIACGQTYKPSHELPSSIDGSVQDSVSSSDDTQTSEDISSESSEISSASSSSSEEQSSSSESSSSEQQSSSEKQSSSEEGTYYHVTFINYDDSVLYEVDVLEGQEAIYNGETPIKPEDDEFTYEFTGWDQVLTNIFSDLTVKAEYSYTAKENWGSIIWF